MLCVCVGDVMDVVFSVCINVDIRHWHMQIYYMNVININTINNYLQSG